MEVHELPPQQGLYNPDYEHENCGLGFIAHRQGAKSHRIISQALLLLQHLKHRGATGSDGTTGDGAGILLQIPHEFLAEEARKCGFTLPPAGDYAVGMIFLPREPHARLYCEGLFERVIRQEGLRLLGWREVPVDEQACGTSGRATRPAISQIFLARDGIGEDEFNLRLLKIRKKVQNEISASGHAYTEYFYVCSLSAKSVVYKGQLLGENLAAFFTDLGDPRMETALAVVHERYSTNTFPQWKLAHPFRLLAHNGEINTLRGNVNWMNARETVLCSEHPDLRPVIEPGGSDSASLDNVVEVLTALGFPLEKAMMILVPEAWRGNPLLSSEEKAFYEFYARIMEPWDGPAALIFTDGRKVGVRTDRNGLRPLRFTETRDGLVIMASEAGVLDLDPAEVTRQGILGPGQILLIDTADGTFLDRQELLRSVTAGAGYQAWLEANRSRIEELTGGNDERRMNAKLLAIRRRCFGLSDRILKDLLLPMATHGREPIGSMGDDRPIAALSEEPKPLCDYFRQAFAQVTNPPIDPIREKSVMSLTQYLTGREDKLAALPDEGKAAPYLELDSPILDNRQMAILRGLDGDPLRSTVLPITFSTDGGVQELEHSLETLCDRAERAVREGFDLLILSDRNIGLYTAPMPSLLALGAVHQHLVRKKLRTTVDLVVEAGGIYDVMHMALLLGYGAKAVNPYLALETLRHLEKEGSDHDEAETTPSRARYIQALNKGLLTIMARMGISTLQSYQGAQIFEVLGLSRELVERHFTGTPVALSGIGLERIWQDLIIRHSQAYQDSDDRPARGKDGFLLDAPLAALLREACRTGSHAAYRDFSTQWEERKKEGTLRGLLEMHGRDPIPLEEVEPVESLLRRFTTGAVSLGAISRECHETLAAAMNRIGARSNSGEGGESPDRDQSPEGCDSLRSAVRQVASGRFGVDLRYLTHCDEIQIKMGQGAKPGEGGHLPGDKVSVDVARLRHCRPGQPLISPPPHHDIYSIEDLAQLIHDLKRTNPHARISVKLAARTGIGTIAAGVAKARADAITLCGHDGGTGAAPVSSMRYVGLPWEIGLAETQQTLLLNGLRDRVFLQVDGRIVNGRDVVAAALLGAEEFGLTTASLISTGCLMCRRCNGNACPVGIATQDQDRRKLFSGRPEYVINYFRFVAAEVREVMAGLGFRRLDDLIGRADLLAPRSDRQGKAASLDLNPLLHIPELPSRIGRKRGKQACWTPGPGLDEKIVRSLPTADDAAIPIANTDRSVGARLSALLLEENAAGEEKPVPRVFHFQGTAGQSFGAFLGENQTFRLEGQANDYLGKGLSGGTIIVTPPPGQTLPSSGNVVAGNTLLYGATKGKAFLNGRCGERFAVRNSGAVVVCEGIGNHGCEYMTGGTVVVLGPVGNNFGAGMTGGQAFLLDDRGDLELCCHQEGLRISRLVPLSEDAPLLKALLEEHRDRTGSRRAADLLAKWDETLPLFVKIEPAIT